MSPDLLCRPYGNVLENTATLGDGYNDHHAGQQAKGIEIDTIDGGLLIQNTQHDHKSGTQQ